MKKFASLILVAVIALLLPVAVHAGGCAGYAGDCYSPGKANTGRIGSEGWEWAEGHFDDLWADDDLVVGDDASIGGDLTVTGNLVNAGNETPERGQSIDIYDFIGTNGKFGDLLDAATDTAPARTVGYLNDPITPALVWYSDGVGVASPAMVTFKLPEDYRQTLGFRLFTSQHGARCDGSSYGGWLGANASPGYVDWAVFVSDDGERRDVETSGYLTAGLRDAGIEYAQTTTQIGARPGGEGNIISETDFVVSITDSAVLNESTDAWVTFAFWRDNARTYATDSIWIHGGMMYYTPEY